MLPQRDPMPGSRTRSIPGWAEGLALFAAVAAVSLLAHGLPSPALAEGVRLLAVLLALLVLARRGSAALARADLRAEQLAAELQGRERLHAMCSHCKSIRDPGGEWLRLEDYLEHHFHAEVSHGVCPECLRVEYPGLFENLPKP